MSVLYSYLWAKSDQTMKKSIATTFYLASIFLLSCLPSCAGSGTSTRTGDLYVSTTGSDQNPGTLAKPFLTPERARDAVREMRKSGDFPRSGVTIWLRGGDYVRTQSLEFNSDDSGSPDAPALWKAWKNERVRFLGGRVLTGFEPLKDADVLARLDEPVREKVLVADLKASGIKEYGTLRSRGFGRPSVPAHGELFFGGLPMNLSRWPNKGSWELIAGFPKETAQDDGHGTIMGALKSGFFYNGDRPTRWKDFSNIWIHGYWAYDWANSYEQIDELDSEKKFIRTKAPYGNYAFMKGQRFCFMNILEELDQPGEWFVDTAAGKLYFWPTAPIGSGEALFSILEQPAIRLTDASHMVFEGIRIEATRGSAIEISGGEGNRVIGCYLCNIGNGAININGGTNHGVVNCELLDTGDGGVTLVGGDRQLLTSCGHFVENCHFQRQARWSVCYAPAIQMTGVGMRASHNLIHDHPHCAILFWGNDHLMEYNDIHHVALETGDVGAIYTGRDYSFRGNRIIHNYIHETGGVGMGSMGVYMDDCVSGTEVYGNVFYKVHWAMFIGGGRDHRVVNNLFVECDPAIRADGRGIDPSPVWYNMVNKTMRERMNDVPQDLYRANYPEIKSLDAFYGAPGAEPITGPAFRGIPPEGNLIERNVCIGKWKEIAWYADEKLFTLRNNYVSADPSQIGSPETGFRLAKDSPAWKMGFRKIPFGEIGRKL